MFEIFAVVKAQVPAPVRASQMKPMQMSPITTEAAAGSNIIKILDQKSRLFIVMASLPRIQFSQASESLIPLTPPDYYTIIP